MALKRIPVEHMKPPIKLISGLEDPPNLFSGQTVNSNPLPAGAVFYRGFQSRIPRYRGIWVKYLMVKCWFSLFWGEIPRFRGDRGRVTPLPSSGISALLHGLLWTMFVTGHKNAGDYCSMVAFVLTGVTARLSAWLQLLISCIRTFLIIIPTARLVV